MSNSKPSNLGCLVYPLSGLGGFLVSLMLFASIGFSAGSSLWLALVGGILGFLVALLVMRSDKLGT
ncbi:MAG: hypothetical protein CL431_01515 [Acidimicrobiaceae bacterium]|jgi:uncharacterized membrane protein YeaQ/YmgE (transglycosylase-associated protein family)|nr:hypothetical protein [Acidimicrobiaceae bacterium]